METSTLYLSTHAESEINFTRSEQLNDSLWSQILSWWEGEGVVQVSPNCFRVSLSVFLQRIAWLRLAKNQLGVTVSRTPEVDDLVRRARQVSEKFQDFASGQFVSSNAEIPSAILRRQLTDEQIHNIKRLISLPNGANFSVPGAGKTTTQLVVWKILFNQGSVGPLLVICPQSAFESWEDEAKKTFVDPPALEIFDRTQAISDCEVLVVNYEQLEREATLERITSWVARKRCHVVLDEAHRVKGGARSVRWNACRRVIEGATRVDLLTGTPMPQGYEDLRNLLTLSWPQLPPSHLSESRLRLLRRNGVFVRTTKSELGLPPLTPPFIIQLDPGELQWEIYSALRRSYAGKFALGTRDSNYFGQRGRAIMTLLASATNPGLLLRSQSEESYLDLHWPPQQIAQSASLMEVVENYAALEIPPKYQWLLRFVKEKHSEGQKVLVWSNFIGNLLAIEKLLRKFNPALVFGSTATADRKTEIERFRNDPGCSVLLSNPQTLGEGISLHHECHTAVYVDRSYNAGLFLQSIDRIHRLGLPAEQSTEIYILETKDTIDQRVRGRLEVKTRRLAQALEDPDLQLLNQTEELEPNGLSALISLDDEDFRDLLVHLNHGE